VSSIKPYISPGQEYGTEEVSGGFVIACSNSAELLEFEEEVLDQMPGLVEFFIVITPLFPVGFWWNNGLDALLLKNFQDTLIGIKGFVSQQCACFEIGQKSIRSLQIAGLTRCQNKVQGIAQSIDNGVDFCA
jgi:hypothetical protein